ncbi:unnamed protein product [Calypogeia fissa]
MKIVRQIAVVFGILLFTHVWSPVRSDDSLEAWSCSSDTTDVSDLYQEKVQEVLNVMEVDIMTHATWDLICQTAGDGDQDVVGSAGCIPSKDMKNMEDCYACIVAARAHLTERCWKNLRGSVFLNSCTLMYARVERTSVDEEWDEMERTVDDDHVRERRAES